MKISFTVFCVLFYGISGFSQKIDFFREDLTFKIDTALFVVDGLYYFRNNTGAEVKQMLFYPFPDVEEFGEIAFIKITKVGDTVSQLATQTTKGALFKVLIEAHKEIPFHISYGQKLKSKQAKYIITTTQKWGKPFEEASYRLEVPSAIVVTSFSIQPDSVFFENKFQFYNWKRRDFMPETDFDFEFKLRNE